MSKVWLIIQREYVERVRTRSFIFSTVLVPVIMAAIIVLPRKMVTMSNGGPRHLVVVTSSAEFGEALKSQLATAAAGPRRNFDVTIDLNTTPAGREALTEKVLAKQIEGFLWAPDEALAAHKVTYAGRNVSDFVEIAALRRAVTDASVERQLAARGIRQAEVREMFKPLRVDAVRVERGKESRSGGTAVYVLAFTLALFLYVTLMMYGITVMRSVIEEKSSRLVEVLLASITARQLIMGKILGVGAVGLTQVGIWTLVGATLSTPALVAMPRAAELHVSAAIWIAFPFFFLCGYLLYSATFAALGAAVSNEHEAQHFQALITLPIIFSLLLMPLVLRQPNAPVSVAFSLFPFTAPIVMYLRLIVQAPPAWQVALGIALLVGAIAVVIECCARIYRVGILMHGKRPTAVEILRWLRYA